jgi:hypothetical protein
MGGNVGDTGNAGRDDIVHGAILAR